MSGHDRCCLAHQDCGPPSLQDPLDVILAALLIFVLVFLTALNLGNNLTSIPPLDEQPPRPEEVEEGFPVPTEAAAESIQTETTADLSYTEFHTGHGYTGIDGDVIELDDLVTEVPESSASSPPSPSDNRAAGRSRPGTRSNSLRTRTPSFSKSRQESEASTTGLAISQEPLQPQQSKLSFFTLLRGRRPNDTESRGSEVHRLEPYDPYYRRRAASVPALRTGIEDR